MYKLNITVQCLGLIIVIIIILFHSSFIYLFIRFFLHSNSNNIASLATLI